MAKNLFRKVSLERLASPEQIDRLLMIVRVPGWIALLSVISLIIILLIWSMVGTIPKTVNGIGMFFNPQDLVAIPSRVNGTVEKISVKVGDVIKEGEELISLQNPSLVIEYETLDDEIQFAETEIASELGKRKKRLKNRLNFERTILQIQQLRLKFLEEALLGQSNDSLLFYGLKQNFYDVQIAVQTQMSAIATLEDHLSNPEDSSELDQQRWELISLKIKLKTLQNLLCHLTTYAPEDGTILEINSLLGQEIKTGSILMWLQKMVKSEEESLIYSFFTLGEGAQIKEGMTAQIAFDSASPNRYGKMIGKIKHVFPFAASKQGEILQSISSGQLRDFLSQQSTTIIVEIEPTLNSETPSGYQWTTLKGPPFAIPQGSLCSVNIIIEEKKLISYLFPTAND
jgi:HlyD family secretion protein